MRGGETRRITKTVPLCLGFALVVMAGVATGTQAMEMAEPEIVTVSGKVVDVSCAVKGRAMMGNWGNVEQDHMTEEGHQKNCATMCLEMGQPAGLFANDRLEAVFACNPRATLVEYAAEDVEVRGFWAGGPNDAARTFAPMQIRVAGSRDWKPVECAEIHG